MNDASFSQNRPKRRRTQFRAFFDEVSLAMGLGHRYREGYSMPQVKRTLRDSFDKDVNLTLSGSFHACRSLSSTAV